MLENQDQQAPEFAPGQIVMREIPQRSEYKSKKQRIFDLEQKIEQLEMALQGAVNQVNTNISNIQADMGNHVKVTIGEGLIDPATGQINPSLKHQISVLADKLGYEFVTTPAKHVPAELNVKKVKKGKK
mgnify:CR=1 FL=1